MKQQQSRPSHGTRPHSAKLGRMANVAQDDFADFDSSSSQQPIHNPRYRQLSNNPPRPRVPMANQHARIMPKNFYHDNEQLYSEVIKLKQRTNTTIDENVRLKTKVAVLQKQRDKLMRWIESEVKGRNHSTSGNQPGLTSQSTEQQPAETAKLIVIKRMLDEAKEQIEFIKRENVQIKKSVKYTKVTEMDIEKRMILEETARLRKIIDEYEEDRRIQREDVQQMGMLEKELQRRVREADELRERNQRFEEVVDFLQQKVKEHEEKATERQKRCQKDVTDIKRKLADSVLEIQTLKRQLHAQSGPAPHSKQHSNNTSNSNSIYKSVLSTDDRNKKLQDEIHQLRQKNKDLEKQLRQGQSLSYQIPQAHVPTNPTRGKRPQTSKTSSSKVRQNTGQSIQGVQFKKKDQFLQMEPIEYKNTKRKVTPRQFAVQSPQPPSLPQKKEQSARKDNNYMAKQLKQQLKQLSSVNKASPQKSARVENIYVQVKQLESPIKHSSKQKSSRSFSRQSQKNSKKQPPNKFQLNEANLQALEVRDVSLANSEQSYEQTYEQSYEPSFEQEKQVLTYPENKTINDREKQTSSKRAMLRELEGIKQLLTYRLKAQRYPFQMIEKDIVESEQLSFSIDDLASMFADPPFFLNDQQLQVILMFLFQTPTLQNGMSLSTQTFIQKLRNLIEDFHLLPITEQQQTIERITLILHSKKQYLLKECQKIATSQQLITKQQLQKILSTLPLTKQSIDIIISEVSLTSQDMQNLAYQSIFKQFKTVEKAQKMSEVAEEEEHSADSGSLQKAKKSQRPPSVLELDEEDYGLMEHQESFSMRAGHKDMVDYQIISDEDIRI